MSTKLDELNQLLAQLVELYRAQVLINLHIFPATKNGQLSDSLRQALHLGEYADE